MKKLIDSYNPNGCVSDESGELFRCIGYDPSYDWCEACDKEEEIYISCAECRKVIDSRCYYEPLDVDEGNWSCVDRYHDLCVEIELA